jgi:hypothetical protein
MSQDRSVVKTRNIHKSVFVATHNIFVFCLKHPCIKLKINILDMKLNSAYCCIL